MSITSYGVRCFGIATIVGGLWMGVGRSLDAATPDPEGSPAAPAVVEGDEDVFGLPFCSPPGRFWLRADYLMWWTSGTHLPALVTTSPQGTPSSQAGVLPGATILYGDQTIGNDGRSGFRTTLGMWLGVCHTWGAEFDYLSLGERANGFSQTSSGDPILARPFFNVETGQQASRLVAYPGVVQGTISVAGKDYFHSAGALLSYNLCSSNMCGGTCNSATPQDAEVCGTPLLYGKRTDLLIGFRYCNLNDHLGIVDDILVTEPGPTQNTTFLIRDNFNARNDFYGSEVGLRTHMYRGRWSLEVLAKIAIGNTHQTVAIDGLTVVTAPNQPTQTYSGGILAGSTNSGTYQSDSFTMIPQLGIELGYQVTCHWRTYVGYNVLYWESVSRAADQISLNLDPRNFPPPLAGGGPFPSFPGKTSSFWAQGVNVGTEFRF